MSRWPTTTRPTSAETRSISSLNVIVASPPELCERFPRSNCRPVVRKRLAQGAGLLRVETLPCRGARELIRIPHRYRDQPRR